MELNRKDNDLIFMCEFKCSNVDWEQNWRQLEKNNQEWNALDCVCRFQPKKPLKKTLSNF
jgi:hypothetical protein